jgi:hypothetical protein
VGKPNEEEIGMKAPYRIVLRLFLGVVLAATTAFAGIGDAPIYHLYVEPTGLQTIAEWGLDFPDIGGLDGAAAPLSPGLLRDFLSRMQPTAVRFALVGSYTYDEKHADVDIKATEAELTRFLPLVEAAGVKHYMLSFVAPPKSMKTYYTDTAQWEFNPNTLRESYDEDFSRYIVGMLAYIKSRGLKPPDVISTAVTPDTIFNANRQLYRIYNGSGCVYTSAHWGKLQPIVRAGMNSAGLNEVGLVGPETFTLEGAAEFLRQIDASSPPLTGLAFDLGSARTWPATGPEELAKLITAHRLKTGNVWIFCNGLGPVQGDNEILIRVFSRLARDLVELHADHWFWRFGLAPQEYEALLDGEPIPFVDASSSLALLWRLTPAGSQVHAVSCSAVDAAAPNPIVTAFALQSGSRLVIAVVNAGSKKNAFSIQGVSAASAQVARFGEHVTPQQDPVQSSPEFRFTIDGESVGIVTLEEARLDRR